jgi:LPS-assembly protein
MLPLALAAVLCCGGVAAQVTLKQPPSTQNARNERPPVAPPKGPRKTVRQKDPAAEGPVILQADKVSGRPDLDAQAEGDVELQRGPVTIRADRLNYDNVADLARAQGKVSIARGGDRFTGPELQLQLQRFEGFFLQPEYFFASTGAGGRAERIDFVDTQRSTLTGATYSACLPDGTGAPAWLLETKRIKLDFEANEGVAEGAVLRFYGVPILAAPVMSFPLTDERKSGWLPPLLGLDNRSGIQVGVPYFWNIAPNRDATFAPSVSTRRGLGLDSEFRYLEPNYKGQLNLNLVPYDRAAERSRHALQFLHEGEAPRGVHYRAEGLRVSDDGYWKDFPGQLPTLTPRLLPLDLLAERRFERRGLEASAYARVQRWQVLQGLDANDPADARIVAPYNRSPQVGVSGTGALQGGFELGFETEVNHFTRPDDGAAVALTSGTRWHALGSISRPWREPGWFLVPKLALNVASYHTDQPLNGRQNMSRSIPTLSVDGGMVFERDSRWFGRDLRQTLEPRLLYVNTPFREQRTLPNFDAAGKDFNVVSVYSENAFSGIDRVSDAHQLTAGVTTRLLHPQTGVEQLRLGVAQRFLFRDQQIAPNVNVTPNADGTLPPVEGEPLTQRFSDLLLFGGANVSTRWTLDGAVQYNPDTKRAARSILSARYSPGPFRTISTSYRLTRGQSEQLEVAWQWPLYGAASAGVPRAAGSGGGAGSGTGGACSGTLYGVGRLNYSLRDSRITDSIVGFEYDAGCWIGRIVAARLSTGRSEATTRLLFQLELVGLSRLGVNPLKVLKDNVPGYRLLREEPDAAPALPVYE